MSNRINGLLECKTEKRNCQSEHGQPMEQTRCLFCTCESVVARCQPQHQCHFWRINSMFEAYIATVNQFFVFHDAMNGCKNLKIHLRLGLKM